MKKIILSMFCIFLLVGCSTKQENITIKKNNNQETVDLKVGFDCIILKMVIVLMVKM